MSANRTLAASNVERKFFNAKAVPATRTISRSNLFHTDWK